MKLPVVHLVGCGSRPTSKLPELATALRSDGWDPYIVPSPVGLRFLDVDRAEACSGHPVFWDFDPGASVELPQADAVVVAPATFNSITKLAIGAADTLALAVTAEAIGARRPVVVVPWANSELINHPLFEGALRLLRGWGVLVFAADQAESFPWPALHKRLGLIRKDLVTELPGSRRTA